MHADSGHQEHGLVTCCVWCSTRASRLLTGKRTPACLYPAPRAGWAQPHMLLVMCCGWRAAPEVLRSPCGTGYNSKQADVWSAGVMLYAMLFCSYPFDRREDADDPKYYAKMTQRIFIGARPAQGPGGVWWWLGSALCPTRC